MINPLESRIEDFLDHICVALVGVVPYERRQELRREIRIHVLSLVEDERYRGLSHDEAIEAALLEVGEPFEIGRDFLEEWSQSVGDPVVRQGQWQTNKLAFGWLGAVTAVDLLLLDFRILFDPYSSLLSPIGLFLALSPFLAGILIGIFTPTGLQASVLKATAVCTVASVIFSCLEWPSYVGPAFAVFQLVLWGPVSLYAAQLASTTVRRLRNVRFWRQVRRGSTVAPLVPYEMS